MLAMWSRIADRAVSFVVGRCPSMVERGLGNPVSGNGVH